MPKISMANLLIHC